MKFGYYVIVVHIWLAAYVCTTAEPQRWIALAMALVFTGLGCLRIGAESEGRS